MNIVTSLLMNYSLLITTECMVAELPKEDAPMPGGGDMGGMGGMGGMM